MSAAIPGNDLAITLNGERREVPAGETIASLLAQLNIAPQDTATALNGEFVPRARRAAAVLRAGDALTCFQPIVGG